MDFEYHCPRCEEKIAKWNFTAPPDYYRCWVCLLATPFKYLPRRSILRTFAVSGPLLVVGGVTVTERMEVSWRANGPYLDATDVDGRVLFNQGATIVAVSMHRITAGTSGSTVADVNLNGTTIFTTQANRPSVTAASGNSASTTKIPDVTSVSPGQYLSIDIDQKEAGNPSDLVVVVEMEPI